jgi:TrmH family RNA methyltransferase
MISKSQVKYIQSLGQKKYRDHEQVFVAEGPRLVADLLQSKNVVVTHLFAMSDWLEDNEKLLNDINTNTVVERELESLSQFKTPNRVIAVVKKFDNKEPVALGNISLVLDTIQDPGNMGTIIRIADWFGINQIVCSDDCADMYNSKVVQATMGSIARVNIYYTDLDKWLEQQHQVRVYATLLEGKDVTKMSGIKEGLILIGNEAKGIDERLLKFANEKITIPKKGKADSLNVAVAAGIVLACLAK